MQNIEYKYPLSWPQNWDRTPSKSRTLNSGFKNNMSLSEAIRFLEDETANFNGANSFILYCDVENLSSERLRRKLSDDSGVCLTFKYGQGHYAIACDKWFSLEHNIYALHLIVRSMRNIERWGVGSVPRALFGYLQDNPSIGNNAQAVASALAASEMPKWQALLGLGSTATIEDAKAVYRRKMKLAINDEERMRELNLAMEEASKILPPG